MAKAICPFIHDNGQRIEPGAEVYATPERLLSLRKLGLVDDSPPGRPGSWSARVVPDEPLPRVAITRSVSGQGRGGALRFGRATAEK